MLVYRIEASILKIPTNLVPEPIEKNRKIGLKIYKLAQCFTVTVKSDVFGISESLATQTFDHVVRKLVVNLFVEHVKMPSTEQEWINETKGFIENNEFPRIGAWDGFHVYLCLKLKKKTLQL